MGDILEKVKPDEEKDKVTGWKCWTEKGGEKTLKR